MDRDEPPAAPVETANSTTVASPPSDKRKTWLKSPAFVSSSQLLELLKGDADDGADKAKEQEQEQEEVGAQQVATGQGEATESSTGGTVPAADVDPFEAPLRAEVEDPFLPDPVVEEEDEDEDIFLSQTEEETKREAAIEAAAIREVFGAPDLKTLFAAVTATTTPGGDGADDGNDSDDDGGAIKEGSLAKKRKRSEDDRNDNKREGAEAGEGTQENAIKKTRKEEEEEEDAVSEATVQAST